MTDKELMQCRKNYVALDNYQKVYLTLKNELDEAKKKPSIYNLDARRKIFAELKDLEESLEYELELTENFTVMHAFSQVANATNTDCNIYVREGFGYEYYQYVNIETKLIEIVALEDVKAFESGKTIIIFDETDLIDFDLFLDKLRLWYFKELLNKSQEVVVRKLVKPETIKEIYGSNV